VDVLHEIRRLLTLRFVQLAALVLLFAGAAYRAMRTMYCVLDLDF